MPDDRRAVRAPTAAVLLAAGEGTRMRSALPKVLHPIGGATLLGHAVAAVAALAPEHLAVVVGHGRDQVRAEVDGAGRAAGPPGGRRGPGAAARHRARGAVRRSTRCRPGSPARCSSPTATSRCSTPATLAGAAGRARRRRRGRHAAHRRARRPHRLRPGAARRRDGAVTGIVEHARRDARAARDPRGQQRRLRLRRRVPRRAALAGLAADNAQGELYLTDLVATAAARRAGRSRAVPCPTTWQVQGVNDRVQLAAAARRAEPAACCGAGCSPASRSSTRRRPGSTSSVPLGRDVVLHPGTQLHGAHGRRRRAPRSARTPRSPTCAVGAGADGRAHPRHASRDRPGRVGRARSPTCGPARGSAPRGKIGTFVEIKNADIGAGSKVPHLTYVGDATIGEEHEHRRGLGVRQLRRRAQAPHGRRLARAHRLGHDVRRAGARRRRRLHRRRHGARDDVPPGALAVSAGAQRTIEGWVEKNRPGTPAAEAAGRYRSGRARPTPTRHQTTAEEARSDERDVGRPRRRTSCSSPAAPTRSWPSRWPSTSTSRSPRSRRTPSRTARSSSASRSRSAAATPSCIQAHSAPINDQIMEQLIMVDALKRASAKRITVVMPFWGYSRQDKKHRGREPISARLVADLFKTAGADRIMTVDLHTAQIQGFFDGPVDHLFALPVLADHVRPHVRRTSSWPSSRPTRAGCGWPSAGPTPSAARRWRSSTRPATRAGRTRPSPTGSSARSRAGCASSSTT